MAMLMTDDEIWKWYQLILQQRKSNGSGLQFCKTNNLDYKKFTNFKNRIFCFKHTRPKEYEEYMVWAQLLAEEEVGLTDFCRKHKINRETLIQINTHVNYLEIIDRLKKERGGIEEPQMNFVQVKPPQNFFIQKEQPAPDPEVMESQNDIEITITKGVKVMISPQVDSTKIIKIIELLKGL